MYKSKEYIHDRYDQLHVNLKLTIDRVSTHVYLMEPTSFCWFIQIYFSQNIKNWLKETTKSNIMPFMLHSLKYQQRLVCAISHYPFLSKVTRAYTFKPTCCPLDDDSLVAMTT